MGDLKFCLECNNLLDPQEDTGGGLKFECKECNFYFKADNVTDNTVFRNNVRHRAKEALIVNPDVIQDSTYGRDNNFVCPNCHLTSAENEVVFYQLPETDAMTLIYICGSCKHWEQRDKNWHLKN
eukprot:GHVL01012101.1.p1 GENE.GHVL01012101.1~~GHVL01012101.1.p1  ORF type:complete len:125 (+),score=26.56 GHVL01012101.1:21-395(+)